MPESDQDATPALGPTSLRVERGGPSDFQSGLASQPSEFQPRPSESPKTAIPKYAHGYDGSTSWQAFLTLFEANATAVEWTDKEATLALVNSLKGQAVTTLQALPPNAIVTGDYQAVGRHLSDSFAASTTTRAAKYSLCSRKQLEGESMHDYGQALSALAHSAFPHDPVRAQQEAAEYFCSGLLDTNLASILCMTDFRTIAEAEACAQRAM